MKTKKRLRGIALLKALGFPFGAVKVEYKHGMFRFKLPKRKMPKGVPKTMKYGKEIDNQWHKNSVFFWCLHCERTYRRGECREIDGLQYCPYEGCNGDTFGDAWPWETIRDCDPSYPVIPEEGKRYPMYPEKGKRAKGKK
jgi:hypothetical protein